MKKVTSLLLAAILSTSMIIPAMAAQTTDSLTKGNNQSENLVMPDSVIYYGKIDTITKDNNGKITKLLLNSERYGEYIMNISQNTFWIDRENRSSYNVNNLKKDDSVYVFHSSVETMSIPPQSEAFAVVLDTPADAGCAQYHEVEDISLTDNGQLKITTDNGGLYIMTGANTEISSYNGNENLSAADIKKGDKIMAWYNAIEESYPAKTYASHIMILSSEELYLTRSELVSILHEMAGSPVVNYALQYTDVDNNSPYIEAIRWASSENLISGYDKFTLGPQDATTKEQFITVLWRYAGSPMLMDYTGLSEFDDVSDISPFAINAMAWAHQKGLINSDENKTLSPQKEITKSEAENIINMFNKQ